uniref:Major facilitator superfamily (MFS) profile domain-containing protein n=1 Tax=Plectus sambesii TaxID=2011161 RepID=A0A914VY92_9BILA
MAGGQVKQRKGKGRGEPVAWQPIATDGGWGWMVVFGSFLIHVFADGIVYSFGVMVSELLDVFGEGRALTSWIVSLLVGLTLGTGPIASAITNKYGCRATTIAGSLVATLGCLLSYFATSVVYLMLTVGVVMGMGFGLMYCPAIVIVTMYFEEKRAFATGIAVCGAGIGTFIFSPLSAWLIEEYTWRGAFLIYAGIVLNCAVCGALFRPLLFRPIYADEYEMQQIEPSADTPQPARTPTMESVDLQNRPPERVGLLEAKGGAEAETGWSKKQLTLPNGVTVDIEAADQDGDFNQSTATRSYVCLTSVLLVDLLGLERLTNAFGLLLLFQGLATLIGPPIAGEIIDRTNNYDYAFLFAGVGLMTSGLMLFCIPIIRKRTKRPPVITSGAQKSAAIHH